MMLGTLDLILYILIYIYTLFLCVYSDRADADPAVFPQYIWGGRHGPVPDAEASQGVVPQHDYHAGLWAGHDDYPPWKAHVHQGRPDIAVITPCMQGQAAVTAVCLFIE